MEKSGAWYAYNGSKIGQGRENAKGFLQANQEMCQEIEAKVRAKYSLDGASEENEGSEKAAETDAAKLAMPSFDSEE